MKHLLFGTATALGLAACSLSAQNTARFGNLPLWFEAGSPSEFVAHGANSRFSVTPEGATFILSKADGETASGRLHFVGASSNACIVGEDQLRGKVNYLVGNNPDQWRTGIPTYSRVRMDNVYPGINVIYYGNQQKLEYDFNLAAKADLSAIALRFEGSEKLSINPQGELVIQFKSGELVQHAPVAYQTIAGHRKEIAAGYQIVGPQTATFALASYDHSRPLVIDPVLTYSTYYGGNSGEYGWAIGVNQKDGSIYVAGQTYSAQFSGGVPLSTAGAFQTNYNSGNGDAFVARFDSSGTNLIYATYLGGSLADAAYSIAVDDAGNAFIAGMTRSSDFPIKSPIAGGSAIAGSIDPGTGQIPNDAFVAKLDPSGSNLVYSTYIGGEGYDAAYGIALDDADNAYITGFTYSDNFPVTTNAFQPHLMCPYTFYINANAFVAEIAANGNTLNYSTYLGGNNYDWGRGIAVNNGRVFVTGLTYSTAFPNTNALPGLSQLNGVASQSYSYGNDGFVTAFASSTTNLTLLYSTYLGGLNYDAANGIAADAAGNAYVAGYTTSSNFPYTTTNVPYLTTAYVLTNTSGYINATNGFLTQIKWDGIQPSIGYSAVFGGPGMDVANGVALDQNGNAYVVGSATSAGFPTTATNLSGYLSATNNSQPYSGYNDAVIIAFNTNASALLYSAYIGGYSQDYGNAIAVDPLGNAYIAGQTVSANFPTVNARQTALNGSSDMFISKISQALVPLAPSLTILPQVSAPSGINLKWQMFPDNYALESAADLSSGAWSSVPQIPAYSNGWYQVTVPATNQQEFFRLHQN